MEKYEIMGLVGEGSYGMVLKCKHKETGNLVAIKKFLESEDDKVVKKIAMREVKMLKLLRHDHLVNLIEVFRRKKRLYLVFEFVDHTVLDELEKCPNGLDENTCRKILWQVLKGTEFCHIHNIIHRDIKPENILVSKSGIVKICDFGFARTMAQPGETYTDYVATRWYRAPELLVGDTNYGKAVDIWAIGCQLAEILTGEPLFPGDSDIDQLYHIIRCFGSLTPRHKEVFLNNPLFLGMRIPEVKDIQPLEKKFPKASNEALDFMKQCLRLDPDNRPTCTELLKHAFFQRDGFGARFQIELNLKIHKETLENPFYRSPATSQNQDNSTDSQTGEGTSRGLCASSSILSKKKKKVELKESLSNTPREANKKDGDDKTKKKTTGGGSVTNTATSSSQSTDSNKLSSPVKKSTLPVSNYNITSLPPASYAVNQLVSGPSTEQESMEKAEKSEEKKIQSSPSPNTSIPPINQSGQTMPSTSVQNPSAGSSSSSLHQHLSSFSPNISSSLGFQGSQLHYRTTVDKGGKKLYQKKGPPQNNANGSQNFQADKSIFPEKLLTGDKGKVKSFERIRGEDRGLSLPEVKGATDGNSKSKEKIATKKSSVSTIPHITNIDPFGANNSQNDNYPEEGSLPTVT